MDAGTETVRCPWNKGKLVGQKLPRAVGSARAIVMQQKTQRPVKFEITERYLGVEVDDALEIAEQTDV